MAESSPLSTFAYEGQTAPGSPIAGTVEAADAEAAQRQLRTLGVRVTRFEPAAALAKPKPLRGEDFLAFNQQLAQLTAAGMPLEGGLRLIAQDLRSGRLAATVRRVADELERGKPLADAFAAHRGAFPPLYGRLLEAGVKSHNLPALLLSTGRHLELLHRLRATLWQAAAYPLVVLVTLAAVLLFLSLFVAPQFSHLFEDFGTSLPAVTRGVLWVSAWLPQAVAAVIAVVVVAALLWPVVRAARPESAALDAAGFRLPLVGRVLRYNALAGWCDALRLGVEAGLDLPAATELAGEAASPALRRDTRPLVAAMRRGEPLQEREAPRGAASMLPATIPAALALASTRRDLPLVLTHLARMYQEQAELRLASVRVLLTPFLLIVLAASIGVALLGLLLPTLALLTKLVG